MYCMMQMWLQGCCVLFWPLLKIPKNSFTSSHSTLRYRSKTRPCMRGLIVKVLANYKSIFVIFGFLTFWRIITICYGNTLRPLVMHCMQERWIRIYVSQHLLYNTISIHLCVYLLLLLLSAYILDYDWTNIDDHSSIS